MKKMLVLFAAVFMVIVSCEKAENVSDEPSAIAKKLADYDGKLVGVYAEYYDEENHVSVKEVFLPEGETRYKTLESNLEFKSHTLEGNVLSVKFVNTTVKRSNTMRYNLRFWGNVRFEAVGDKFVAELTDKMDLH